MSVFISYRHTDRHVARAIASKLKASSISYYLDVIDNESQNTEDITEVITKNIKKSTHLLAVISPNTGGSWWVPFEIGQATIVNRRICSYATAVDSLDLRELSFSHVKNSLPEYLKKWPMLVSSLDLEKFIQQYKRDSITVGLEESGNRQFDNLNSSQLTRAGADSFHRNLKSIL